MATSFYAAINKKGVTALRPYKKHCGVPIQGNMLT
jgi:hypothetical protein